jgi:flagellin-specific chaperone FliS
MKHRTAMAAAGAYRVAQTGGNALTLIVALLDAALAALMRAGEARRNNHLDTELRELEAISRIVLGLNGALDRRRTLPLIARLERFYLTVSFQALSLPRRKDPLQANERLAGQIRGMRDAWAWVARQDVNAGGDNRPAAIRDTNVVL